MARHCTPQNPTHQIAIVALRKAAPVSADFGPDRVGRVAAIAASSASTASTKASMSLKASHEAGEVLAVLTAVPICCGSDGCCEGRRHSPSPSRASALIHLKVASRSAPAGTPRLRTGSYTGQAGDLRERFPRVRIRLRGDSHYACPEVMNWCEARGIEYIFGLAGTAPLTARVQTLEARTGGRYAARRAAEPPGFKLRRYMDFRGKSWKCERRIGSKPDPTGSTPANRHEPDRPPGAAALRAEILPERENLLKSFTWPPIGPPAREPA